MTNDESPGPEFRRQFLRETGDVLDRGRPLSIESPIELWSLTCKHAEASLQFWQIHSEQRGSLHRSMVNTNEQNHATVPFELQSNLELQSKRRRRSVSPFSNNC